jgi:branched-subunit amino acid transport protein AzlD
VSNILNMLDRYIFRDMDLAPARLGTALLAVLLIVFGLIWEGE